MRRAGMGLAAATTIGVLSMAIGVALTSSRQDLALDRRPLVPGAIHLSARARAVAVPLPRPFDARRAQYYDEVPRIVLSSSGDEVRAWMEGSGFLDSVFAQYRCVIRGLTATCEPQELESFCGTGPTRGRLTSRDPQRYSRLDYWGGRSIIYDRTLEVEFEVPFGAGDAMALEQNLLLQVQEHRLLAYRIPSRWMGRVGRPRDLGATRHEGPFERCDLGAVVALYGVDGDVILGRGLQWSLYETHDSPTARGIWTCAPEALRRVDLANDGTEFELTSCTSAGCEHARHDLPPELQAARTVDAAHLGDGIAVLFTDARGELRTTMLGADGFSPTMPVARHATLARDSRGHFVMLVSGGRLFAGILTLAGPAILVIDAAGTPAWVRSEARPELARFEAANTFPADATLAMVDRPSDQMFRLIWRSGTRGERRTCSLSASPWATATLECGPIESGAAVADSGTPPPAAPAELVAIAVSATEFMSCTVAEDVAWIASRRDGGNTVPIALAIGATDEWTLHALDPVHATIGCFGDGVSLLSVENDRVRRRRCDRSGCSEVLAAVPAPPAGSVAIDLGDRVALLEPSAGGALIARVGTVESLADTAPIEVVDAASAFVPLGTGAVAERTGVALLVGRTAAGVGVLRFGSDARADAVRRPWRGFELGGIERVAP